MAVIDVAAGALINAEGKVLLAQRPAGKHMAGYWEFPGGKFEPQETATEALRRELQEELGIAVRACEPLITLSHDYSDRKVRLHIFVVTAWDGVPQSLDKQALNWVPAADLPSWDLLPADAPIATALRLPHFYPISPQFGRAADCWVDVEGWLQELHRKQYSIFQWRQLGEASDDSSLAVQVADWAAAHNIQALLNGSLEEDVLNRAAELGFSGVHLRSQDLTGNVAPMRKVAVDLGLTWLAASCHSAAELKAAKMLALDFVVLGSVRKTGSHPNGLVLGEVAFRRLAEEAGLPVYALGGCAVDDCGYFRSMGAQGVAGIRTFAPQT